MINNNIQENEIAIACEIDAFSDEQKQRWFEIGRLLYQSVRQIKELPDGYALGLPITEEMIMIAAEDVTLERLCCPFLHFAIVLEPLGRALWLEMRGHEDVKVFLRTSFENTDLIAREVIQAAGFQIKSRIEIDSIESVEKAIILTNDQMAEH